MAKTIDKSTKKLMSEFAGFYVDYSLKKEQESKEDIFVQRPTINSAMKEFLKQKHK